jgi:hypothetical protein
VRIRIRRPASGIVEGISLSHFIVNVVYDVPRSLAMWLIAQGTAEEDVSHEQAIRLGFDQNDQPPELSGGGVSVVPPKDTEDDRPPRTRRGRRRDRSR